MSRSKSTNALAPNRDSNAVPRHRLRGRPLPLTDEGGGATDRQPSLAPYDVGYKKPPKASQFRKGQSGNPKGRAKGTRNTRTIFEEESLKQVAVTDNGKTRKLSKRELVMMAIINKAVKGDDKAQAKYLKLDERFSDEARPANGGAATSAEPLETFAALSDADQIILERLHAQHSLEANEKKPGSGRARGKDPRSTASRKISIQ